jgi:hypothetical protein
MTHIARKTLTPSSGRRGTGPAGPLASPPRGGLSPDAGRPVGGLRLAKGRARGPAWPKALRGGA